MVHGTWPRDSWYTAQYDYTLPRTDSRSFAARDWFSRCAGWLSRCSGCKPLAAAFVRVLDELARSEFPDAKQPGHPMVSSTTMLTLTSVKTRMVAGKTKAAGSTVDVAKWRKVVEFLEELENQMTER